MANVIDILARFKDEASRGLQGLGLSLDKLARAGIEPIAKVSPTAAKGLEGLIGKLGPTGLAAAAVGGAAVGAAAGLTALVTHVADLGDRLREQSIQTGVSVEQIQAIGKAMEKSGISAAEFATTFRFMQNALGAAGEGAAAQGAAFRKLGLDVNSVLALSPSQQFETLAKAITGVADPTQKAGVAIDLFGRAGTKLLPTLQAVADEGIAGLEERARRLGGVLSTEAAENADKFNDQLADLKSAVSALAIETGAQLIPAFLEIVTTLTNAAVAVNQFVRDFNLIEIAAKAVQVVVVPIVENFKLLAAAATAVALVLKGEVGQAFELLVGQAQSTGQRLLDVLTKPALGGAQAAKAANAQVVASGAVTERALSQQQENLVTKIKTSAEESATARITAEAKASGNAIAVVEAEVAAKIAAIEREKTERLKAIDDANLPVTAAAEARKNVEIAATNAIVTAELGAAEQKKQIIANEMGLRQEAASTRRALAEQVVAVELAAEQAVADAKAKALEGGGLFQAAADVRLQAVVKGLDAELAATKRAEAEKVQVAQDALDKIATLHASNSVEVATAREKLAAQQRAASDTVAAKEVETAAKMKGAYLDADKAIRQTLSQTIDLVERLTGKAGGIFARARFDLAREQAAKLKEEIALLAEKFPETAAKAEAASKKIDQSLNMIATGKVKDLEEGFGKLEVKTDDAAKAAESYGERATASLDSVSAAAGNAANAIAAVGSASEQASSVIGGQTPATGNPFGNQAGGQGPSGSFDLPFLLQHPEIAQSRVPGTNDSMLQFLLRQMKAQRRAQERASKFLDSQFNGDTPSGFGTTPEPTEHPFRNTPRPGDPRRVTRAGDTIVNVNMKGPTFIDNERSLQELGTNVGRVVRDRDRRGLE